MVPREFVQAVRALYAKLPGLRSPHLVGVREDAFSTGVFSKQPGRTLHMQDVTLKNMWKDTTLPTVPKTLPSLKEKLVRLEQSQVRQLKLLQLIDVGESPETEADTCSNADTDVDTLKHPSSTKSDNNNIGDSCEAIGDLMISNCNETLQNFFIRPKHDGSSLCAARPFKCGEVVFLEKPLHAFRSERPERKYGGFSVHDDHAGPKFVSELDALTGDPKRLLDALCEELRGEEDRESTYLKLRIPLENAEGAVGTAVYSFASHLNHSCAPNIEQSWDSSTFVTRFVATRDIKEGVELTVAYVSILSDCSTRRELIKHEYGFMCSCRACVAPFKERSQDNKVRNWIRELEDKTERAIQRAEYEKIYQYGSKRIQLLKSLGLDSASLLLPSEYDMFQASFAMNERRKTTYFLDRALEHSNDAYGYDSAFSRHLRDEVEILERHWELQKVMEDVLRSPI